MSQRINRCSHCGCDEPILGIDGKLYCDNCGMCLEKLEGGLTGVAENKISVTNAVKLLKEMRYNALNATQYDDEKREAKAEALKMAIEALGGKDDGRE